MWFVIRRRIKLLPSKKAGGLLVTTFRNFISPRGPEPSRPLPCVPRVFARNRFANISARRLPDRCSSKTMEARHGHVFRPEKRALGSGEWARMAVADKCKRIVAYFSMEIALENSMPSYSGG